MQKKTPREELIEKIKDIIKNEAPESQLSDFDISRIIYNNHKFIKDDFLHARKIRTNSRISLLVLLKIIYNIQNLEITNNVVLKKLRKISTQTLEIIKLNIRKIVIDFIFGNPYKTKYIKQDKRSKHQRRTDFWRPEFKLFLNLWYTASLNNKGPITIKKFQQTIGNLAFSTPTKIGKCNTKYFYNLFKNLDSIFSQINQVELKQINQDAKKYIQARNLTEIYKDYSIYWDDELTKKALELIILMW